MVQFLDLSPKIRLSIYQDVFTTPTGLLLGPSKVSKVDYCCPACFKKAKSQQDDTSSYHESPQPTCTNVALLYTSRLVNAEATTLSHSINTISLYSENNADILTWLHTIGAANRTSLRHLEVDFSYGVRVESQRFNVRHMLAKIKSLRSRSEEERHDSISSWIRHDQMKQDVKSLEAGSIRMVAEAIQLIAERQKLVSLVVLLPGRDGGDMWDVKNDQVYFAEETFSEDIVSGRGEVVDALCKVFGLEELTIGYTQDLELAEIVARHVGAGKVTVRADSWLGFSEDETNEWEAWGWKIERTEARKMLLPRLDSISVPGLLE